MEYPCLIYQIILGFVLFQEFLFVKPPISKKTLIQARIINGKQASPGQFPYHVLIDADGYQCGGSIINQHKILTAAHCLFYPDSMTLIPIENITIYGGDVIRNSTKMKKFNVREIRIHNHFKNFGNIGADNDIAIIKILGKFWDTFKTNFRPVEIIDTQVPDQTKCFIVGWGVVDKNIPEASNSLRYSSVQIFNRHICQERYRRAWQTITNKMICGMASGTDTCQGDSGSPLMCNLNGTYYVTGITSWGIDCASEYYPGVYTDVFTFRSWVLYNHGFKINASYLNLFLLNILVYILMT